MLSFIIYFCILTLLRTFWNLAIQTHLSLYPNIGPHFLTEKTKPHTSHHNIWRLKIWGVWLEGRGEGGGGGDRGELPHGAHHTWPGNGGGAADITDGGDHPPVLRDSGDSGVPHQGDRDVRDGGTHGGATRDCHGEVCTVAPTNKKRSVLNWKR